MLADKLTEALILAKNNQLSDISEIYDVINPTTGSSGILADLDHSELVPVPWIQEKEPLTLDSYTVSRSLTLKEADEYLLKLHEETKTDSDALQRYAGTGGKEQLFKISFLIKLAFECGLSFDSFRKLAYLAGHSFHGKTCYPPYFFLKYALCQGSGYEEYKNALLDINVLKALLENDILRLNNCENFYFSPRLISDYHRRNREKYKTSFMRALENRNFQADFIRYFFEGVYINGKSLAGADKAAERL